jgi:hypothetical protein
LAEGNIVNVNWVVLAAIAGAAVSGCALLLALWKFISFLGQVSRLAPVLRDMANQFKTDTGSSLKDQINRLEAASLASVVSIAGAKEVAELARQAATHQTVIMETIRMELLRQGMIKVMALGPGESAPIVLPMPAPLAKEGL